jgi:L-threonylcarbamoyladenylate synthase
MPRLLPVDARSLQRASELLQAEQVVAFPTETVYGLGGSALSTAAIERIYVAKGRPSWNPLIVHVADTAAAAALVSHWPESATRLARQFWPGPLTLVLPRAERVPAAVSAGRPTIALRVPAHAVALQLLRTCGLPLAAPSANRSQGISPTRAEHVAASLRAADVPLILDGGPCRHGIESTVVDLTFSPPRLLRPGATPLSALREILPDLALPATLTAGSPELPIDETSPASPGLMRRHYAPRTPLTLLQPPLAASLRALPAPRGLLTHVALPELAADCAVIETLPYDAAGYAADLYAALHRLDDAWPKLASLAVLPPPWVADAAATPTDDLWLSILDRLLRAAAPPSAKD